MTSDSLHAEISLLVRGLKQAYSETSWHGTNLRASLRRVSVETALWRPQPERHNIWELTLHCAYEKYSVLRRLVELPRGFFPRRPNSFPVLPDPTDKANWAADRKLLDDFHQRLVAAVAGLEPGRLDIVPPGSATLIRDLVLGVGAHDHYHSGQIQLLKRLQKTAVAPAARQP